MTLYHMIDAERCETFEVARETPKQYIDARGNAVWKRKLTGVEQWNSHKRYMTEEVFRATVKIEIDRSAVSAFLQHWMKTAPLEDLRKIAGMFGYKERTTQA